MKLEDGSDDFSDFFHRRKNTRDKKKEEWKGNQILRRALNFRFWHDVKEIIISV